ncbi:MAG: MFS transporter [Planctomycetes bacterium]|nr:MFS transporter [Planctomycetota bacterium]
MRIGSGSRGIARPCYHAPMVGRHVKEYARQIRRFSPNARRYLGATFIHGFSWQVMLTLYNLYLKELHYAEGIMGGRLFFQGLGTVLVAIPAAIAIDRLPLKRVMTAACVANAATFAILAFATSIRLLQLVSFLWGASMTVHIVAASPFFMRNSSNDERTHLFSVNQATSWLAGFLGALAAGHVPGLVVALGGSLVIGYRAGLLLGAAVTLAGIGFYARIETPAAERRGPVAWRAYLTTRDWGTTIRLCLPLALIGMGAGLIIPFFNMYFTRRFSLEAGAIGRIFAVGQLFTVVGFLAGPLVGRRIGLTPAASITQLASIPFFLILAFTGSLPLAVGAYWLRGSLMNMAWPLYNNFAMESVAPDHHAGTNSLLTLSWNAAWMVSALASGALIEAHGFVPVMLATIGIYILVSLMILLFFGRGRRIEG